MSLSGCSTKSSLARGTNRPHRSMVRRPWGPWPTSRVRRPASAASTLSSLAGRGSIVAVVTPGSARPLVLFVRFPASVTGDRTDNAAVERTAWASAEAPVCRQATTNGVTRGTRHGQPPGVPQRRLARSAGHIRDVAGRSKRPRRRGDGSRFWKRSGRMFWDVPACLCCPGQEGWHLVTASQTRCALQPGSHGRHV